MKKYEKAIIKSIEENRHLRTGELTMYLQEANKSEKELNKLIKTIFKYMDNKIDDYTGIASISNLNIAFSYLKEIQTNLNYDRDLFTRRLVRLEERIDRVKLEKEDKFINQKYAIKQLEKIKTNIEELEHFLNEDINEYIIVDHIINKKVYMTALNQALKKSPDLVNIRNKNGISLYQNILRKCIDSIKDLNEDDILYFQTVKSIIQSQSNFKLSTHDINSCLKDIYVALDEMSISKSKNRKQRKSQIEWMTSLKESLLGGDTTSKDINHIASKYHINISFPSELEELYQEIILPDNNTTRIINNDYTITIDNGAYIIDDALSCKRLTNGNYLLGIHIADPLGYFSYESDIIQEAIDREKNIYLKKKIDLGNSQISKTIPIIDFKISADVASLIEGSPKFTRSHFYEINKYEGIVNEFHPKTITMINKNTNDKEIENVLLHGTNDINLQETVSNLRDVSEVLSSIYPQTNLHNEILDNNTENSLKKDTYTYRMIQLMSIVVGNTVANKFYEKGYPCLYRVHYEEQKDNEKLRQVIDELKERSNNKKIDQLYDLVEGIYPRGRYELSGPNMGLNLEHYCHMTSPLRRGPDIIMEHAYEICFDNNPTDKELIDLEEELTHRKEHANIKDNKINLFQDEVARTLIKRRS